MRQNHRDSGGSRSKKGTFSRDIYMIFENFKLLPAGGKPNDLVKKDQDDKEIKKEKW